MSFKKIDKEYCLTDDTVNSYGFRLLTAGWQQSEYTKNPIGFYMHDRSAGVVLRWEDFRTEGDKVYAKPVVNLSHPRGKQTLDEAINGFLNGASVGHLVVLEASDEPDLKLPGQTGPTVTKWFNRECSLVDIPGNFSGLALYDADGNTLNLSDFSKTVLPPSTPMSKFLLSAVSLAALKLGATATEADAETAIQDLAARQIKLTADLVVANDAKTVALAAQTAAENALADFKKTANAAKVESLKDAALAAGKGSKEFLNALSAGYAENPDGLESLLAQMPAHQTITSQLNDQSKTAGDISVAEYDKLFATSDGLENLKASNPERFKALYKVKFNKEHKG